MTVPPFTYWEAISLVGKFEHLTMKEYVNKDDGKNYTILFVSIIPFEHKEKTEFMSIFFNAVNDVSGYRMADLTKYLMDFNGDTFDIAILCIRKLTVGTHVMAFHPTFFVTESGKIEYCFDLCLA